MNGPAAGPPSSSRSPLAAKKVRPRPEGEASLCAIKITREEARTADQRQEPRLGSEQPVAMGFRGDEIAATVLNISSTGAMIACAIDAVIGERLELTFPGDERIEGIVRWVRDDCLGIEFGPGGAEVEGPATTDATDPVTARREPPPLQPIQAAGGEAGGQADGASDPAGHRSVKRARVLLAAVLETTRGPLNARLRDLSCKGALLECPRPLAVGEPVVFSRGETVVRALVAWADRDRVGIEFNEPIHESEVLIHINRAPPPSHSHVQATERSRAQVEYRRPNFNDRLSDYDRKLARVIGASLGVSLIDE